MSNNKTIAIGDSITGITPSWFEYLCGISEGRFNLFKNNGVGGSTTTQFNARYDAQVLSLKPDIIFICGGINDGANGDSVGPTIVNYRQMIERGRAIGANIIVFSVAPSEIKATFSTDLNTAISALCAELGVLWIDMWGGCRNGSNNYLDATFHVDTQHPTPKASRIAATSAISQLQNFPKYPIRFPFTNSFNGGIYNNSLFLDKRADGITPVGWGSTGFAAVTTPAGSVGNDFTHTMTSMTSSIQISTPINAIPCEGGQVYRLCLKHKATGLVDGVTPTEETSTVKLNIYFTLSFTDPAKTSIVIYKIQGNVTWDIDYQFTVPQGSKTMTLVYTIQPIGGASISGAVSISQFQFYNEGMNLTGGQFFAAAQKPQTRTRKALAKQKVKVSG